jgi:hypothetical protein
VERTIVLATMPGQAEAGFVRRAFHGLPAIVSVGFAGRGIASSLRFSQ